jgi:GT2 family glycosyltransferase
MRIEESVEPRITVVVCNFNKADFLMKAVASVKASRGVRCDVIVVDNASTDDSVPRLAAEHPDVEVVRLPENVGGSGGFGRGMREATDRSAPYVLLLDNDASLAPDTLEQLVSVLEKNPQVGAVGPAVMRMDFPENVQDVGALLSQSGWCHMPAFACLDIRRIPKAPFICEYLSACALLTRRTVIEEVGVFAPEFFIYWDDVDWCTRVRKAGYDLAVLPSASAWHKGGLVSSISTLPRYYNWRNRLEFFRRHPDMWDMRSARDGFARDVFETVVGYMMGGFDDLLPSLAIALEDARDHRLGPATNERVPPRTSTKQESMKRALSEEQTYALRFRLESEVSPTDPVGPRVANHDVVAKVGAAMMNAASRPAVKFVVDGIGSTNISEDQLGWLPRFDNVRIGSSETGTTPIEIHRHFLSPDARRAEPPALGSDAYMNVVAAECNTQRMLFIMETARRLSSVAVDCFSSELLATPVTRPSRALWSHRPLVA